VVKMAGNVGKPLLTPCLIPTTYLLVPLFHEDIGKFSPKNFE